MVMTKSRFLLFFGMPRTSVMPSCMSELGHLGVQFHWDTNDTHGLERLHNLVLQIFHDGVGLAELRYLADLGKELLSMGLPFAPPDAPLPQSIKEVSGQIRRVI